MFRWECMHGFLDTHLLIHSWCDIARNRKMKMIHRIHGLHHASGGPPKLTFHVGDMATRTWQVGILLACRRVDRNIYPSKRLYIIFCFVTRASLTPRSFPRWFLDCTCNDVLCNDVLVNFDRRDLSCSLTQSTPLMQACCCQVTRSFVSLYFITSNQDAISDEPEITCRILAGRLLRKPVAASRSSGHQSNPSSLPVPVPV